MKHLFFVILFAIVSVQSLAAEKLTFQEYLARVKENNLELKLEEAKLDAAKSKANGVSIPPPMISAIQMREQNGVNTNGYQINQTIPFPTKLVSNHSVRKYEAQAQAELNSARVQELSAQAKFIYFSLWSAQEKIDILKQKKTILENHIKLSTASTRSDSSLKIHLLKAESDLDLVENDLESAKQVLKAKQIEAANFINTDAAKLNLVIEAPPLSELPQAEKLKGSHQIAAKRLLFEASKSKETEMKQSWLPDLNLQYKQMGESSMAGKYNEVMIGVTLPFLFFWEPSAASAQAKAERLQAEIDFNRENRNLNANVGVLRSKAESLKRQIENLQNKLIPRAEKRMQVVHNIAPRDMESLQDHRETSEAFPELKLKELELRELYEMTVVELNKYLSEEGSHE